MASFFNLTLDTTAPSGLSFLINDGAQYTTTTAVDLSISMSDGGASGYQMKVWGINGVATEGAASWESFATEKAVVLTTGDGQKTISIKVRDDVGNETNAATASILLDTAVPSVTITGPDRSKVSKVSGYDEVAFSFLSDVPFVAYKVKAVPSGSSLENAGTQIGTTSGSSNMAGSGTYAEDTPIACMIHGADLEAASSGDGVKVIKVFVQSAAGSWSVA